MDFLTEYEKKISKKFLHDGYIVEKIASQKELYIIEKLVLKFLKNNFKNVNKFSNQYILNNIHKFIKKNHLNHTRLAIINYLNSKKEFLKNYYLLQSQF